MPNSHPEPDARPASKRSAPQKIQLNSYRPKHRQANDKLAHDEAAQLQNLPPVIEHPLVPQGKPDWIDTPEALGELLEHLRVEKTFGYDTEFIGETTFRPRLCVIQIATASRLALIDPLPAPDGPGLDLTSFWEIVTDPSIEKILHAGQQDLEPALRHTGHPPRHIFDTQTIAGLVGLAYPMSLTKLAEALIGATLAPGVKFSQWDRRPLTRTQHRYAADDVRYLPAMTAALKEKLTTYDRVSWAEQEMQKLEDPDQYIFDPHSQKLKGVKRSLLTPRGRAILHHLITWRAEAAVEQDMPTRAVVKDEVLFELSLNPVKAVEQLERVKHLPRPVKRAYGTHIVDAIQQAMAGPVMEDNRPPRPSKSEKNRMDKIVRACNDLCEAQDVNPTLAFCRADVTHHVMQPDAESRLKTGWRHQVLGDALTP